MVATRWSVNSVYRAWHVYRHVYAYDVGGRLKQAVTGVQTRTYLYDNRGFLLSASIPERGPGAATYSSYDPLGNAGHVVEGPFSLNNLYDRSGRLLEVWDVSTNQLLKRLTYGLTSAGDGSNWSRNRLVSTESNHYQIIPNYGGVFRTSEWFDYGGVGGAVSEKRTKVGIVDGGNEATFQQAFTWDDLGQLVQETYPVGKYSPDQAKAPVPTRSLQYRRTRGQLTGVSGWAETVAWHGNGTLAQITHGDGSRDVIDRDNNWLPRPYRMRVLPPSGTTPLWNSGYLHYDGGGKRRDDGGRLVPV